MKKVFQFHFRPCFFIVCLALFSLCCALGVWQIHRYTQKKTLLILYQKRLHGAPLPFAKLAAHQNLQFQSVTLDGQYLGSRTLLVQNRFYHDALGFEVLTALKIAGDKKLLLIDRGWIEKPKDESLPPIKSPNSMQAVKGYIKLLNEYQFTLGKNILQPNVMPLVMQKIDINEISQLLHQSFYPFILRLDASRPNGFVRDWVVTSVPPERHMAYAVQWFLLAIVLCISYVCFCCERKRDE